MLYYIRPNLKFKFSPYHAHQGRVEFLYTILEMTERVGCDIIFGIGKNFSGMFEEWFMATVMIDFL